MIVSNPPYVADHEELPAVVGEWEPSSALRRRARRTRQSSPHRRPRAGWLTAEGALVLEMAPDQTDTVAGWAEEAGMTASVHPDLAGRPRAVVAHKPPE